MNFPACLMGLMLCMSCFFTFPETVSAQDNQRLHVGYYVNPSLNLYHRMHQRQDSLVTVNDRSAGQVLNLLPSLSAGFWMGKTRKWSAALEAGLNFYPFSFNLQEYQGLGAAAFPMMLRGRMPLLQQQSMFLDMQLAVGMEWNKVNLYGQPDAVITPSFWTYSTEVSVGLAAISQKGKQLRGIDYFCRLGFGQSRAMSFQMGLRFNYWNSFLR